MKTLAYTDTKMMVKHLELLNRCTLKNPRFPDLTKVRIQVQNDKIVMTTRDSHQHLTVIIARYRDTDLVIDRFVDPVVMLKLLKTIKLNMIRIVYNPDNHEVSGYDDYKVLFTLPTTDVPIDYPTPQIIATSDRVMLSEAFIDAIIFSGHAKLSKAAPFGYKGIKLQPNEHGVVTIAGTDGYRLAETSSLSDCTTTIKIPADYHKTIVDLIKQQRTFSLVCDGDRVQISIADAYYGFKNDTEGFFLGTEGFFPDDLEDRYVTLDRKQIQGILSDLASVACTQNNKTIATITDSQIVLKTQTNDDPEFSKINWFETRIDCTENLLADPTLTFAINVQYLYQAVKALPKEIHKVHLFIAGSELPLYLFCGPYRAIIMTLSGS